MMKKIVVFFLSLFAFGNLFAQQSTDTVARPRLIVTIAIDGLRSDYLSTLWDEFEQGGFRRLIRNGAYCRNMTYPYWSVGNVADYATVYTGTIPADHSLCSDSYWDPKTEKDFLTLFDKEKKGIGTNTRVSPKNLKASTFVDELKLNTLGRSKILTIAINPEEAVVMAGHAGNATVWIDDSTGTWATSNYYTSLLPSWAAKMNDANPAQDNVQRNWTNLYISSQYKTMSAQSRASAFFAYPVTDPSGKTAPFKRFKESPFANTMVKNLAISSVKDDYIGIDENPDIINLQFTLRGFNQSTSGVLTSETEDMYLRLDKDLHQLMDALDATCGTSRVMYVVYAPQTDYVSPDFLSLYNVPTGYFVVDRSLSLLNTYLMAIYGQGDFVHGYANRQIFLNKDEIQKKKLDVKEVELKVADFMTRFQGVQFAFRSEDLLSVGCQDERIQMIKNCYNKEHAGDVMLYLQPGWVAVPTENVKVGLSTRVNNYAPFIISGWRVKHQTINQPFSAIDIAPTISNMLRMSFPSSNTGKPLLDIIE